MIINIQFTIGLIVAFYAIGEFITYQMRNSNIYGYIYATIIRVLVIALAIVSIIEINSKNEDYDLIKEANSFKYEIIKAQWNLIDAQDTMINSMEEHMWNEHDCDIPMYDSKIKEDLDIYKRTLDSLYSTQL